MWFLSDSQVINVTQIFENVRVQRAAELKVYIATVEFSTRKYAIQWEMSVSRFYPLL